MVVLNFIGWTSGCVVQKKDRGKRFWGGRLLLIGDEEWVFFVLEGGERESARARLNLPHKQRVVRLTV
jgi:hypothetical protein